MLRKLLSIVLAVTTVFAMGGCRTASSAQPTPPAMSATTEVTTPSETPTEVTVATEATEETESTDEAQEPTETTPDEAEQDYFQSDDFILVNSPDFEPFKFSHIQLMLEREGIDEIDFLRYTKPDSVIVGKIGDVIVGQMQMDSDDIIWNVRIEKADNIINNTGIDISSPEIVEENELFIHGIRFICKRYVINLADFDAMEADVKAGKKLNFDNAGVVEIHFVFNETQSYLYTFCAKRCWSVSGEQSFTLDPPGQYPDLILKSEADYELEALQGAGK